MIKHILGIVAISLLLVFPAQAAGQETFVRDICVGSPNAYKEVMEIHKKQGFDIAQTRFWEIMNDPNSDCYVVPGTGRIPVIVLETLQGDNLRDVNGVLSCATLYRVKMKGQSDPTKKYFAVNFIRGMCNKNSI